MVTKKRAIDFAVKLGWTQEDAKRAYEKIGINFNLVADDDEFTLALALADYAGEVLYERQRKQAAQKAQVTKKTKEIERIQLAHAEQIKQYKKDRELEHSKFVGVISYLYKFAQKIGIRDPWIETLLVSYNDYLQDENDSPKDENDSLKDENDSPKDENDSLKDENDSLKDENDSLKDENDSPKAG